MTRQDVLGIMVAIAAAPAVAVVALSGDAETPAGLLLIPIVVVAVAFMSLWRAIAFSTAIAASLGLAYWANFGSTYIPRIAAEGSLIVLAAMASHYAVSRIKLHSTERLMLERIHHASNSSPLLDTVYSEIHRVLADSFEIDRITIVAEKSGSDDLEIVYAAGIPITARETGDDAPLVNDDYGWTPVGEGRVQLLSGLGTSPEANIDYMLAGLKSGMRLQLGSRRDPTGYIELRSQKAHAYSKRDAALIAVIASEVSITIGGERYRSQVVRVGEERVSRMRVAAEKRALEETRRRLASMNERLETQNEIIRRSRERLINADEAARQSIAEELHGPVQTKLLLIWHALSAIRADMDGDEFDTESLATSLDDALGQLDVIREEDIRLLSHRLHPSIVRVSALAGLRSLQEFYESTIPVTLDVSGEVEDLEPAGDSRIPESIRLTVHRVADAAMANVVKHAGATEAVIHWNYNSEKHFLELSVTDDGRGFEPDARAPSGLGLLTIRDYVDAIGGNLSVTSFPGEGTGVDVVIPFVDEQPQSSNATEDPGAIGSVLNMHWAPPANRSVGVDQDEDGDEPELPHAIGQ